MYIIIDINIYYLLLYKYLLLKKMGGHISPCAKRLATSYCLIYHATVVLYSHFPMLGILFVFFFGALCGIFGMGYVLYLQINKVEESVAKSYKEEQKKLVAEKDKELVIWLL